MAVSSNAAVATAPIAIQTDFTASGFLITPPLIDDSECAAIAEAIDDLASDSAGSRNLLDVAWARSLAIRLKTMCVLQPMLPDAAVAIQCTYFDKSPDRNWRVAWHQDLSAPIQRPETSIAWRYAEKEGVIYVQPPAEVLRQLLAVRVHLDPSTATNGSLRVIPGSHRHGRIAAADTAKYVSTSEAVLCTVPCGGALVLRPLLLHASSKSLDATPRRVLHFVFAPGAPPTGLRWHRAV